MDRTGRRGVKHPVARSFGRAAASYDQHSPAQRHAAARLDALIGEENLPSSAHVLELGCGTGHLTQLLAARFTDITASDIAPAMVRACRARLPQLTYLVMDGEHPAIGRAAGASHGFDLICASLAAQWFFDLPATLRQLADLLAPNGVLAISTLGAESFHEWKTAHQTHGLHAGTLPFIDAACLRAAFPSGETRIDAAVFVDRLPTALDLPRQLRAIGATTPASGHQPLNAGDLRRVLRSLGPQPAVTYQLLYARFKKARA